jgi:hypothetical protein
MKKEFNARNFQEFGLEINDMIPEADMMTILLISVVSAASFAQAFWIADGCNAERKKWSVREWENYFSQKHAVERAARGL